MLGTCAGAGYGASTEGAPLQAGKRCQDVSWKGGGPAERLSYTLGQAGCRVGDSIPSFYHLQEARAALIPCLCRRALY